jgi:CheY-like chemotaxis protein
MSAEAAQAPLARATRSGWPVSWLRSGSSAVKIRILIVADDAQVSGSLAAMLDSTGSYETRQVRGAVDALAAATEFPPAILFLDVGLPQMNGFEMAWRIRQRANLRHTRLIALTADNDHATREQARAAGFERFLATPVTEDELHKVLRRRTGIRD